MVEKIILYAGFSGITVFLGGIFARLFNHHVKNSPVKDEVTHTMIAFGAGIMLSAIALVLIPEGIETLALIPLLCSFCGGALLFYFIDKFLSKMKGQVATLMAMLVDFIPESIALGAVFAHDLSTASLLAVIIGLQNLPESFNAYRDMVLSGFKERTTLLIFFLLSFTGIAGALMGHFLLSNQPIFTAHLMTLAGGGILYLLIQDIIPESKFEASFSTSLGATLGFAVGMIGEKII